MSVKFFFLSLSALIAFGSGLVITSCSTPDVQDTRADGLERRQSRMDSRTAARQERWKVRGEREDARAAARFDSW